MTMPAFQRHRHCTHLLGSLSTGSTLCVALRQIFPNKNAHEHIWRFADCSVSICVTFEWAIALDSNIVCLFFCQLRELGTQSGEMKGCHLLIKMLWKQIHIVLVSLLRCLQQVQLSKHLVCE